MQGCYHERMRIVGIDPGLATVGIGLVEANGSASIKALEWLTIETKAGLSLAERLCEIGNDLDRYLTETQPELAVIEKLFFSVNVKTALDVAQARGVILATVARHGIPIMEPTPPELKSCITGDGNADKLQIQQMLVTMFGLKEIPTPDDAADALALAAYGAFLGRRATLIA